MDQAGVLLLDSLDGLAEALQLLHLELELLLVDVHRLELAAVIRHPALSSSQVSGVLCAANAGHKNASVVTMTLRQRTKHNDEPFVLREIFSS